MSDLFELDLLRNLIRGQVHRVNNVLTTLEFAIAAYVPKDQRGQLTSLSQEVVRDLGDLRSAVSPMAKARDVHEEAVSVVAIAQRLATQQPGQLATISLQCGSGIFVDAEQAWFLIRACTTLFTLAKSDHCSEVEVSINDINEIVANFRNWTGASLDRSHPAVDFLQRIAAELDTAVSVEHSENRVQVMLAPSSQDSRPNSDSRPVKTSKTPQQLSKLLIVEDSPTLRILYKRQYLSLGIEVQVAEDSASTAEVLKDFAPDLVLVDAQLGEQCGVSLSRDLAKNNDFAVVVMSGDSTPDYDPTTDTNILGFLLKPFKPEQLFALCGLTKTPE